MAALPYLVLSPSGIMGVIGLLHGPDRTVPTPQENWCEATIDLLIPAYNEEKNIVLCLSSILKQTRKPQRIILVDDASTDRTVEYAKAYSQMMDIKLEIIQHEHNEGKTPALNYVSHDSQADVLFVLDADTILLSENYIERVVMELFQGVGISSACGVVLPFTEVDRKKVMGSEQVREFVEKNPHIVMNPDQTRFQELQRSISNAYREELYLFLQGFIYRAEKIFFGTIIFPIGCAVAYRRKYIEELFDRYSETLGNDLTTSEDIFIGFSFADQGYRNVVVQDVYGWDIEPRFFNLPKQLFKWSSSFLQSCYYFDDLLRTPFKFPRYLIKCLRERFSKEHKKQLEKRRIKEAYRQPFGSEYTKKYGRNIGWFIFTSAFEKISFPTIVIILIILKLWEALAITIGAEVLLYCIIIAIMHKNRRIRNFFKSLFFTTPIRYMQLLFDLYVMGNFMKDLWITKNRSWRK